MAISWQVVVAGQAPWSSAASAVTNQTSGSFTLNASGHTSGAVRGNTFSYSISASNVFNPPTSRSDSSSTYIETSRAASGATFDGMAGTSSSSHSKKTERTIQYYPVTSYSTVGDSASTSAIFSTVRAQGGTTYRETRYTTSIFMTVDTAPYSTLTSSTTATGIATGAYNSGTSAAPATLGAQLTTTQTATRSIITGHSVSSLSSTESISQTYTETIASYDVRATTEVAYVTGSYVTGSNHLLDVWQAEQSEYLRGVTTIASTLTNLLDALGPTATQLTISDAVGQISYGAAVGGAFATITTSNVGAANVSTTLTTTVLTYAPLTIAASDGWIGGTDTRQEYASGLFTDTVVAFLPLQLSTYGTGTVAARLTYATKSVVTISYIFSDTITGVNATGGSATHGVHHVARTVTTFNTTIIAGGDAGTASSAYFGYSATLFTSPAAPAAGGVPLARLSRLERAFGYQHASHIGSGGGRGASVSANSLFFIGTNNYAMGDPNGVLIPAPIISTAATADSSYSFSAGSGGEWTVTAFRTDTSSSTLTTFTASVGTAGAAEFFINRSPYAWDFGNSATVLGGPNALTGIPQKMTFGQLYGGAAAGWKYTLKDSFSTTAYTTHLEAYTTATIGTSMIALESFSAAPPNGLASVGPIAFMTLPFN